MDKEKDALVLGGSNGIGLSIALNLQGYDKIWLVDKVKPSVDLPPLYEYLPFDLLNEDYSFFDGFSNVRSLIITAGFGRLALFKDISDDEIIRLFSVNTIGVIRVIRHFYNHLLYNSGFRCVVLVSISGYLSSPYFSIYGASKAALAKFIESVNAELNKSGSPNRVLNVSPGSIAGTSFNGRDTDLLLTSSLALEIIKRMDAGDDLFIPDYEDTFKFVLKRYHDDFRRFGLDSYEYKKNSKRLNGLK